MPLLVNSTTIAAKIPAIKQLFMETKTEKPIRAFVAIDPNNEVLGFFHNLQKQHQSSDWAKNLRWTKPQNIHLTMRFLGNVTQDQLDLIAAELHKLLINQVSFKITVTSPQPFPSLRKTRMIASLVHKNRQLDLLAAGMEQIAIDAGLTPEKRAFRGHLTIGRFRKPAGHLEQLIKQTTTTEMPVDSIIVYKSDLKPTGPEYTVVYRYSLAAP